MLLLLGMVLGAILAILLFGTNLLGPGNLERLRSVLGTQQQTQQPAVKPMQPAKKPSAPAVTPAPIAPASTPCCTPPSQPILTSTPTPQVVLTGQPQTYYNSWGWWLVDPNGSFHCPPVFNPTIWTGGMKVLVQRNGVVYETWAPSCYR